MTPDAQKFILSTSPFMKRPVDTPSIMRHVFYSLVPVMLASIYYFGLSSILVILACVIGCTFTEWLIGGRGSIMGAFFGALIVGVFTLGLRDLGADAQWTFLLIGALIIAAVAIDQWIRKVAA